MTLEELNKIKKENEELVMVRKVMDTVSYEYCDGKNVLTMSKNLDV